LNESIIGFYAIIAHGGGAVEQGRPKTKRQRIINYFIDQMFFFFLLLDLRFIVSPWTAETRSLLGLLAQHKAKKMSTRKTPTCHDHVSLAQPYSHYSHSGLCL
jgi:hypothetical protein